MEEFLVHRQQGIRLSLIPPLISLYLPFPLSPMSWETQAQTQRWPWVWRLLSFAAEGRKPNSSPLALSWNRVPKWGAENLISLGTAQIQPSGCSWPVTNNFLQGRDSRQSVCANQLPCGCDEQPQLRTLWRTPVQGSERSSQAQEPQGRALRSRDKELFHSKVTSTLLWWGF